MLSLILRVFTNSLYATPWRHDRYVAANYIQQVDYSFVLSTQIWKIERNGSVINQMKRQFFCKTKRIDFSLHLTAISQFYKFKKVKLVLIMCDKLGRV